MVFSSHVYFWFIQPTVVDYDVSLREKNPKTKQKNRLLVLEGEAADLRKHDGAVKCCKIHKTSTLLEEKLKFHDCDN